MSEFKKWANIIGIGAILWWLIDVVLPFIPFGGLAFWIGLAYIIGLVLSKTLFKDSAGRSSSIGSTTSTDSASETLARADNLQI